MKTRIKGISLVVALVTAGGAALWSVFAPPLVPTTDYIVKATIEGHPIEAEILKPLFMPGIYYVKVPDAQPTQYRWFGVAVSRQAVFRPNAPYTGFRGLIYIHRDQAIGVNLMSAKIEDHWTVTFRPGGVDFSNGSLAVTLSKT